MPDGRILLLGGNGSQGPVDTAMLQESGSNTLITLKIKLNHARSYHTATILPDGSVFVFGGIDRKGQVVGVAELIYSETGDVETLPGLGLTPRAYHSATLLTDGRVFLAGGASSLNGSKNAGTNVEVWDPKTRMTGTLSAELHSIRLGHNATLLGNGMVLLSGGFDLDNNAIATGELFDPENQTISETFDSQSLLTDPESPFLNASLPQDAAIDLPLDTRIALRFSKPLRVETINDSTVTLTYPDGPVAAKIIPAESGRLAFISPSSQLLPGITYSVSLNGLSDGISPMPPVSLSFTTKKEANSKEANNTGTSGSKEKISGASQIEARSLPPLQAPPGVTGLAGQALMLDGSPLANVVLEVNNKKTRTDNTGRFVLFPLPSGHQEMIIDGSKANQFGSTYGIFEVGVDLVGNRTNVLGYSIWMTPLDIAHRVTIPSPTSSEVVVTNPTIPGLELRIPAGTVITDHDGKTVRELTMTLIPLDRPPFPLPQGVDVPIYFTIQPGAAYLNVQNPNGPKGARLIYPNIKNYAAGARIDFWNYDPDEKGWYIYGQGTVTDDRRQIIPDRDVVIYEFTGAMVGSPGLAPAEGPAPGGCPSNGQGEPDPKDGDPVECSNGLFIYEKRDLYLTDVLPINLTRTYRSKDSVSRAFGIGATHPYDIFLVGDSVAFSYMDLILPDGGRIHFNRISPGTYWADAILEHTATPTRFYKSRISWNGNGWDLKLKDGTLYVFPESSGATRPMWAALLRVKDRFGNILELNRDASRNLTKIISPNGRWIEFTYDTSYRVTQAKDNLGRTVGYTYDASGRLWKATDPNGGVEEYGYDTSHRMLTVKNARLITFVTNEYDANGRVFRQTHADGKTFQFAYTLDGSGKVTQTDVTRPGGDIRRLTFSSSGYALTQILALGKPEQQSFSYQRQAGTNLLQTVTDPLSRVTSYSYDSMANLTGVTRMYGTTEALTTSFTYEPTFNQLATITDPLNHTITLGYDGVGNLTSITDPLNHQTTLAYNAGGQPISITDALQHSVQLGYALGDLATISDPLNRTLTRFTDAGGRLLSSIDPIGNTTHYEYDVLNRLAKITDPLQGQTQFNYDPNNNLLSLTDARNNSTSFIYDNMDRIATRRDQLLHDEIYQYNDSGILSQVTDRKSQVRNYTYDFLQRLSQVTYADASTTTYTYDGGNRLTQIADSISGTITRTYDNHDRPTSEVTPQGTISYTYDNDSRRATMTVLGQPTINYTYDNANRLTTITQGSTTVSISYDDANRRTSLTLPNSVQVIYGYDNASQLTSIDYKLGTTILGNLTYDYDQAGRRTKVGGSFARTGLPQVLSSATYSVSNQLAQWGTGTLTYDLNGNLISDGQRGYVWNARDQLISINGTVAASFQYDGLRRRMTKTVSGGSTSFLYDRLNIVQELAGTSPTANLLTGLSIDETFLRTDALGARNFLGDALRSTLALQDSAATIQTQYYYEPFGKTVVTGSSSGNSSQFAGRENDNTILYYFRARYYHPSFQRFINEDPIGFGGGQVNLFTYVNNDPTMFTDPLGTQQGQITPEVMPPGTRPGGEMPGTSPRMDNFWEAAANYIPTYKEIRSSFTEFGRLNPYQPFPSGSCPPGQPCMGVTPYCPYIFGCYFPHTPTYCELNPKDAFCDQCKLNPGLAGCGITKPTGGCKPSWLP